MRQHSLLWLIVIVFIFLFAPLFVTTDTYLSVYEAELDQAIRWYSPTQVRRIGDLTDSMYRATMQDSGIESALIKYFVRKDSPVSAELAPGVKVPDSWGKVLNSMIGYWSGALLHIRLFLFRVAHFLVWCAYLIPFLAAIIFDGLMRRKAKIESFKYTSPTRQSLSWHSIIALIFFSIVYFSIAVTIPIWYIPVMVSGAGVLFRVVIANVQHSA